MSTQQLPLSDRLNKIEESATQVQNAVNAATYLQTELIAVAFTPGVEDIATIVSQVENNVELEMIPLATPDVESSTRLIKLQADKTKTVLNKFLTEERVQWAGPVVAIHERSFAYLTHELIVQIDEGADAARVLELASDLNYERLRKIPYVTPATYHLRAKKGHHPGRELFDHARQLMEIPGVLAEPNLAGTAEPDVANIPELHEDLWDRKQIRTEEAWKLLREKGKPDHQDQDIVLAVVDGSLDSEHPALEEYERLDFRYLTRGGQIDHLFGGDSEGHGMRVAGVAAADGTDGVYGVAPDCEVKGLFYPASELDVLDMYLWAAGIDPKSPRKNFPPELPKHSADVIITSVRFGFSRHLEMSRPAAAAFDLIAREGRGGKGSLLFFSAGNSNADMTIDNPWAAHDSNFGIAASTLDGKREVRAAYSNYRGVELCAPSSETLRKNKKIERGVLSLALAGRGDRGRVDTHRTITTGNYTSSFGGTSSAAPLVAGVAALVLTARPELRHDEVRQVLRDSAVGIDLKAKGDKTVWRDEKGRPAKSRSDRVQSWAYGFGRVDAKSAVQEALDFKQSKTRTTSKRSYGVGNMGVATVSLILGLYHLIVGGMLCWFWPGDTNQGAESKYLAWIAFVLAFYHLVIWAVLALEPIRRWWQDSPDDEELDLMDPDPG